MSNLISSTESIIFVLSPSIDSFLFCKIIANTFFIGNRQFALISLESIDSDNTNVIYFESFNIKIDPDKLYFTMKYDSTKHPSYMKQMIEKYFDKIFARFSVSLSDPLFLY